MDNSARAEKIVATQCPDMDADEARNLAEEISSQLDEAVKEAIETFIIEATENDPRLAAAKAKFIAQGYAAAREQSSQMLFDIISKATGSTWQRNYGESLKDIAERIRSMQPPSGEGK